MNRNPLILCAILATAATAAWGAVPQRWTVETSRVTPVVFDAVRGETLALEAAFQSYGKPLEMGGKTCGIYWQTNGMGTAWWHAPATVTTSGALAATTTNVIAATFTPQMDPGAATVSGFLGATGDIYRAVFTLRFRNGPGAVPNVITQPPPVLDLGRTVVINPPWPTQADYAATTTVMRAELKAYVDQEIEGAGLVTHQAVTNAAGTVTSNVVTKAYVEGLGIESGLDTNAVATVITNHVTRGYLCTVEEANLMDETMSDNIQLSISNNYLPLDFADYVYTKTQSDEKYAQTSTVGTLQSQVSAIGAHLNAEDAHFVSTNYDSAANMAEAYVEIKMSNTWITIWREMTRWNRFAGDGFDWGTWQGFQAFRTNVTTELEAKADRAWGAYDSETGGWSPEGYTQISSSNVLIAAGMAYQRTVVTGGAVWVLQCNTGVAHVGADTNGFFRICDGEGNVQFEIVKGNKREVGADAVGITVDNSTTPPTVTIPYSVESDAHPKLKVCADLTSRQWKDEDDAACVANVSWSGTRGAWVATVRAKAAPAPQLFVSASYMSGGETYINNVAPVAMQYIYLGGHRYSTSVKTVGGETVLGLTLAD